MTKHIDAAKRALRSDRKNIFYYRSGAEARLLTCNGPWSGLSRSANNAVVILPPFAEEMNRCRRLISLTQDTLANSGICSVSIDYRGTGDSAGDFVDARLSDWARDTEDACALARATGARTITLLGFRFGGLLAAQVANKIPDVKHIYAIAPQDSLQRAMRQFIRIASTTQDQTNSSQPGLRTPGAAKRLEAGETLEIGGYELSPHLYRDFANAAPAIQSKAKITAMFVGSGTHPCDTPSTPEIRQLKALRNAARAISYTHVDDAQMWYQGIPDEPRSLPQSITAALTGDWPIQDYDDAD